MQNWEVKFEGPGPVPSLPTDFERRTGYLNPGGVPTSQVSEMSEGLWDQACNDGAYDLARGYAHGITAPISPAVELLLTSSDPEDHIADTARAVLETTTSVLTQEDQELLALLAAYRKHLNDVASPLQSDRNAANHAIEVMRRSSPDLFQKALDVLKEVHISKQ